jgi:hypothetical protein
MMIRTFHVAILLTSLILLITSSTITYASDKPDISKVGFVLYTKSSAPGTLNARWMYGNKYRGSGIATGGPREGYAGSYHVRYFLENGDFANEYDLVIEKVGDIFEVSWLTDEELKAVGVGMEVESGLAVGWYH